VFAIRETGYVPYPRSPRVLRRELEQRGLEPAGENGIYFQKVRFRKLTPLTDRDSFVIRRNSGELKFAFAKSFLMWGDAAREDTSAEGTMIFVGYGVTALEQHYDDYAGVDVNGKIAVVLSNAPASFPSTDRAFYSDDVTKLKCRVPRRHRIN
jgi:hypothetical protein